MTRRRLLGRLLAAGTVTAACGGPNEPPESNLVVTVTTAGADTDPDSYLLQIGGRDQHLAVRPTVSVHRSLAAGTYEVRLTDVAPNCSLTGPDRVQVTLTEAELTSVAFTVECRAVTGHIRVTTATTGRDFPADYRVTLTGSGGLESERPVPANAAGTIDNLKPDVYEVALGGLPPNCAVTGSAVQTATVTAGGLSYAATPVDFAVECTATTGDVRLVATTTGVDPDQDGYTMWVDGQEQVEFAYGDGFFGYDEVPIRLTPNGDRLLSSLSPGDHTVELRDVAANCSVEGANPRTVTVNLGAVSEESFRINCVAS